MEEGDKIIIRNLKEIGWEAEEDVSLKSIEASDVASAIILCLRVINSSVVLPPFPSNVAQRYKAATAIVECIKELNYSQDIDYPLILYPNEVDLRNVFSFLIDKLPKEVPNLLEEHTDKLSLLHRAAKRKLNTELNRPWIPLHAVFKLQNKGNYDLGPTLVRSTPSEVKALVPYLDYISEELQSENYTESGVVIGEHNSKINRKDENIVKISLAKLTSSKQNFEIFSEQVFEVDKNVEQEKENMSSNTDKKDVLKGLQDYLQEIEASCFSISKEIEARNRKVDKIETKVEVSGKTIASFKEQIRVMEKLNVAANPKEAKQQLMESIEAGKSKEQQYILKWIEHKKPLEEEVMSLKHQISVQSEKSGEIYQELNMLKKNGQKQKDEILKKSEKISQLKTSKSSSPEGDIKRSEYTGRILEINDQIERQKAETEKVIDDVKLLHKDINKLTTRLNRTFTLVDNLLFKKSYEMDVKDEYRILIAIHEGYGDLISTLHLILNLKREISMVDQQLEALKKEKPEKQLLALQNDLKNVILENEEMKKMINVQVIQNT